MDAESDLLAKILLPLAGPEEFDDEDNEKLPLDLQYLSADKVREPNTDLRKMLVEIFIQVWLTCLLRILSIYIYPNFYWSVLVGSNCLWSKTYER